MTLDEFRQEYPEYEDMSDADVLNLIDLDPGQHQDNVVPALFDIEEAVKELCAIVKGLEIPKTDIAPVVNLLKQVKNALGSLETAVKSIDVNVTVPPAKAPVITVPAVTFPEQKTNWVFDVKRDKNGFISEVIARA